MMKTPNEAELMARADRARGVLESVAYQDAYRAVREKLLAGIENCPIKEVETAEDLRKCLRLLKDVQSNMEQAMNLGKLASFKLAEEKQRNNPFRNLFR